MKRNRLNALLCIILCGWLLNACVHTRVAATERAVAESLAALPSSADFQTIVTTPISGHPGRVSGTCTYGDVSQALITDLAPQQAVTAYTQLLEAAGWAVRDSTSSHVWYRGQHEQLVLYAVESDKQAWVEPFKKHPTYQTAREQGKTVLIVDLTYIDPQRDGC